MDEGLVGILMLIVAFIVIPFIIGVIWHYEKNVWPFTKTLNDPNNPLHGMPIKEEEESDLNYRARLAKWTTKRNKIKKVPKNRGLETIKRVNPTKPNLAKRFRTAQKAAQMKLKEILGKGLYDFIKWNFILAIVLSTLFTLLFGIINVIRPIEHYMGIGESSIMIFVALFTPTIIILPSIIYRIILSLLKKYNEDKFFAFLAINIIVVFIILSLYIKPRYYPEDVPDDIPRYGYPF